MLIRPMVSVPQWLTLSHEVRVRLAAVFNLPRTANREVIGNELTCDGHSHKDLANITTEKMQIYVGTDGDFHWLFNKCAEKAYQELLAALEAEQKRLLEEIEKEKNAKNKDVEALEKKIQEVAKELDTVDPTMKPKEVIQPQPEPQPQPEAKPKMTPAERMAKARAARQAKKV